MEMPVIETFEPVQPNLNAEVYRGSNAAFELLRAPNIEFLKIYSDNTTLVGSSDLTGRYWNGAATVSNSPEDAIAIYKDKDRKQLHLESGTTDGCFLDSNKIILTEDSGCLSIWSCSSDSSKWFDGKWIITESITEHDDSILTIDVLQPPEIVVTGAADGCIKVWNLPDMVATTSLNDAHSHSVNQVAVKPESTTTFISCSLDRNVILWDLSSPSKVRTLATLRCGVCCICWYSDHELLCGSDAGDLVLVDIRGGQGDGDSGIVKHLAEFPKSLRRIVKNSQNSSVALTCDSNIVYVTEIDNNKLNVVYENDFHTDDVKAICFDQQKPNVLYSGSWDGSIIKHEVSKSSL